VKIKEDFNEIKGKFHPNLPMKWGKFDDEVAKIMFLSHPKRFLTS